MTTHLEVIGVTGMGDVHPGEEIADLITAHADLRDGDVVIVTQKIVSKAEGRLARLDPENSRERAAIIEAESVRVLRRRGELVVSETVHGFVCANAGVDLSNVEKGYVALLPVDPDRSARHIRDRLRAIAQVQVAVIVTDTFGRPWRKGLTDVAIGCAGIAAIVDLRGTADARGRTLEVTEICIADELAAAGELVMGKSAAIPVAVVRGADPEWLREGSVIDEIVRPSGEDLFR